MVSLMAMQMKVLIVGSRSVHTGLRHAREMVGGWPIVDLNVRCIL